MYFDLTKLAVSKASSGLLSSVEFITATDTTGPSLLSLFARGKKYELLSPKHDGGGGKPGGMFPRPDRHQHCQAYLPRGYKYPNVEELSLKCHVYHYLSDLLPLNVGTWTVRGSLRLRLQNQGM